MKPIFKFISIFFILLNFNLFADCTPENKNDKYLTSSKRESVSSRNEAYTNQLCFNTNKHSKQSFIVVDLIEDYNVGNCGYAGGTYYDHINKAYFYYNVHSGNLKAYSVKEVDKCLTECPKGYIIDLKSRQCIKECQGNEVYNPENKKCESCPEGFFLDPYSKTCESKQERPKWCPEPMIYKERQGNWKIDGHRTIKECLPDSNINEDECKQRGMKYHGPCADLYGVELNACLKYPTGCYANETSKHFGAQEQLDNDLFSWSGFMFSLPIDAIKNGWNALSNFMKSLFKSPNPKTPNPNLLEYRPQIVDMRATKNGPEPIFDLRAVKNNDIFTNHIFKILVKLI